MRKRTWAAVVAGTAFLCIAGTAAAQYAKGKLLEEAVLEVQRRQQEARQQETQGGYILIHTTDGEAWGFCGDVKVISDGTDGGEVDIEMTGWLVGSTHKCYNPEKEGKTE